MLSKCEICRLKFRSVLWIDKHVVCDGCFAQMLNGALVPVRSEPGDTVAYLTGDRELAMKSQAELLQQRARMATARAARGKKVEEAVA